MTIKSLYQKIIPVIATVALLYNIAGADVGNVPVKKKSILQTKTTQTQTVTPQTQPISAPVTAEKKEEPKLEDYDAKVKKADQERNEAYQKAIQYNKTQSSEKKSLSEKLKDESNDHNKKAGDLETRLYNKDIQKVTEYTFTKSPLEIDFGVGYLNDKQVIAPTAGGSYNFAPFLIFNGVGADVAYTKYEETQAPITSSVPLGNGFNGNGETKTSTNTEILYGTPYVKTTLLQWIDKNLSLNVGPEFEHKRDITTTDTTEKITKNGKDMATKTYSKSNTISTIYTKPSVAVSYSVGDVNVKMGITYKDGKIDKTYGGLGIQFK